MARIGWYVLGSVLVGYGALQVLGRRAGSTRRNDARGCRAMSWSHSRTC